MLIFCLIYNLLIYFLLNLIFYLINIISIISSKAGGRKIQKKKEIIGRNNALLIFTPYICVLHLCTKSLNN